MKNILSLIFCALIIASGVQMYKIHQQRERTKEILKELKHIEHQIDSLENLIEIEKRKQRQKLSIV